jgi:hypothetical protein
MPTNRRGYSIVGAAYIAQPTTFSCGVVSAMIWDRRKHNRNKPALLGFRCGDDSDVSGFRSTRDVGSEGGILLGLAERYEFGEWLSEQLNRVIDGEWNDSLPPKPSGRLVLLDLFDGFFLEEARILRAKFKPGYTFTNLALGEPSTLQPLAEQLQHLLNEVADERRVEMAQVNESLWK